MTGVTLDTVSAVSKINNTNTIIATVSITVANNPNRCLVVGIAYYVTGAANAGISSVKIGSTAFTKAASLQGSTRATDIWYLKNPPTGASTITITLNGVGSADVFLVARASSWYNVDQTTTVGVTHTNSGTSSTPSNTITPGTTGSIIIDNIQSDDTSALTSPNKTQDWSDNSGVNGIDGASQHNLTPTIGSSNTLSWASASQPFVSAAIELLSAGTANTESVTDAATLSDSAVKQIGVPATDSPSFTDSVKRIPVKGIIESPSLTDSVMTQTGTLSSLPVFQKNIFQNNVFQVGQYVKSPSDAASFQDTVQKQISKKVSDISSFYDIIAKNIDKILLDTPGFADVCFKIASKAIQDNILVSEITNNQIQKTIQDSVQITETQVKNIKKSLFDSPSLLDTFSKVVNKVLSESSSFTDNVSNEIFGRIAVDFIYSNIASVNSVSPSTSIPVTITTDNDRLLLVCISSKSPLGSSTVGSMDLDGVPMGKAVGNILLSQNLDSEIWYILNPSPGAHTININYTGLVVSLTNLVQGVISLYNVDQVTGINLNNLSNNSDSAANPSVSIIPLYPNSLIIDNVAESATGSMTGPSDVEDWSLENTNLAGASQQKENPTPGTNILSWSSGAGALGFTAVALEVLPVNKILQVTDSVSVIDFVTVPIFVNDVITSSDAIQNAISKFVQDPTGTLDTVSKLVTKTLIESVALSDAVTKQTVKAMADSPSFTDSVSLAVQRYLTDNIVTQDVTKNIIAKNVIDAIVSQETVTKPEIRQILDSASFSDSVQLSIRKFATDNITVSDTAFTLPIYVADALALGDSVSKTVSKTITDNAVLIDNIVKNITKAISDLTVWQDTTQRAISKSLTDVASFSDSARVILDVQDNASIVDKISKTISKNVIDAIQVKDISGIPKRPIVSDIASLTDQVTANVNKKIAELVQFSDSTVVNRFLYVSDQITTNDTIQKAILKVVLDTIISNELLITFIMRRITFHSHIIREVSIYTHVLRSVEFKTHIVRTVTINSHLE